MSQEVLNSWNAAAFAPKPQPQQWQSNNQNIPMASNTLLRPTTPNPGQQPQQSNYHTGEDTDYSIDSTRSAKFGGMKKRVRITGTPMTGIGTQGPDATMMATGGATHGYGDQQPGNGYALNRWWGTPGGPPGSNSQVQPFAKVGTTLPKSQDG